MSINTVKSDILIIGGGPAGLTAALYAARAGKKTLILEGKSSSRLSIDYTIENYPGFPSIGSGELLDKFRDHALGFGAEFMVGDAVAFGLDTDPKYVTTKDSLIEAKAVIIATGKPVPKARLIPGEDRLLGQGVSYCATCDGPLFRGAAVAAFGSGEEAVKDVAALHEMGCRIVWIPGKVQAEEKRKISEEAEKMGIPVRWGTRIEEIVGESRVEKIDLEAEGTREEIPVNAVFIFRDIPAGPLFSRAGITLDHKQCVAVDRFQRTNISGVYAAGDVTCGGLQVVTAAGEGCVAALQALSYLRK